MARTVSLPYYETHAEIGTKNDDGRLSEGMLYLVFRTDKQQKWVMSPEKAAELIDALVRTLAELPVSSDVPPSE